MCYTIQSISLHSVTSHVHYTIVLLYTNVQIRSKLHPYIENCCCGLWYTSIRVAYYFNHFSYTMGIAPLTPIMGFECDVVISMEKLEWGGVLILNKECMPRAPRFKSLICLRVLIISYTSTWPIPPPMVGICHLHLVVCPTFWVCLRLPTPIYLNLGQNWQLQCK